MIPGGPCTRRRVRLRRWAAGCVVLLAVTACTGPGAGSGADRGRDGTGEGRAGAGAPVDFDGDGFADAAVIVTGSAQGLDDTYGPIAVLRGGKDGLRPTGRPLVAGSGRRDAAGFLEEGYASPLTGDLDGDGRTDLAVHRYVPVPNSRDNQLTGSHAVILYGTRTGLVNRPVRVAIPADKREDPFHASAIGDVNGDGHPDLVDPGSSSEYGTGRPARVAYGPFSRNGTPAAVRPIGTVGGQVGATAAVATDFDRDGRTDLLLCTDYDEEYEGKAPATPVRYFRGTPKGPVHVPYLTEQLGKYVSATEGASIRAGADLDGDGYPDVLPPGGGGHSYRTYLRGGPGGLGPGTFRVEAGGQVGSPLLAGDVTGDGRPELVSTVHYGPGRNRGRIQLASPRAGPRLHTRQHIDVDTAGVPGDAFVSDIGKRDHFAERLLLLDADRDGHTDVLAAENITGPRRHRYGGLWYLPGGPNGLRVREVRRYLLADLGIPDG